MQTAQNRIEFLFLLDYLASSFIISSAARVTFQKVLIECQNAWQKWWRPVLGGFRRGEVLKDNVVQQNVQLFREFIRFGVFCRAIL